MLNGHEELDSYDHKKYPIPAYIQRSASAPAIAEHVSMITFMCLIILKI
mgnify:CR=1 FL=1